MNESGNGLSPRRSRVAGQGWFVVAVTAIGLSLSYSPIVPFTFGLFVNPLSREFNWSRSEISAGFSIALLAFTLVIPLIGRLVDRHGARRVILPCILVFGLGLMSLSLSSGLSHFYAIFVAIGAAGCGTSLVPYSRVISQWFDRRRGLALGLGMTGVGIGALFMPLLAEALIRTAGWRQAYIVIGGLVIAVAFPVVCLFLKEAPNGVGVLPDGAVSGESSEEHKSQQGGHTWLEARQTATFWIMASAFFLVSASIQGCLIHMAPMLEDRGIPTQSAALASSAFGAALLFGRVLAGYLMDRIFAPYVAVAFFSGATAGIFSFWTGRSSEAVMFLAAFLLGLGIGAEGDIIPFLISRYFGLRAFGEIYGYALAAFTLGGFLGPIVMATGYEYAGDYRPVLAAFAFAVSIAALLMTRLGAYRVVNAPLHVSTRSR